MGCEGSSIKRQPGLAVRAQEAGAGQSFLDAESSRTANPGKKWVCFCRASGREILGVVFERNQEEQPRHIFSRYQWFLIQQQIVSGGSDLVSLTAQRWEHKSPSTWHEHCLYDLTQKTCTPNNSSRLCGLSQDYLCEKVFIFFPENEESDLHIIFKGQISSERRKHSSCTQCPFSTIFFDIFLKGKKLLLRKPCYVEFSSPPQSPLSQLQSRLVQQLHPAPALHLCFQHDSRKFQLWRPSVPQTNC